MAKKKGPKLKKSQRKRSKYQCPPHMDPEEFQARRKAKYSKEGRAMLKADQQARRMFGYNKLKSRLTKQGHVSAAQPRYQDQSEEQSDAHPAEARAGGAEEGEGDREAEGANVVTPDAPTISSPDLSKSLALGTGLLESDRRPIAKGKSAGKQDKKKKKSKPPSQIQILGDKVQKQKDQKKAKKQQDAEDRKQHDAKIAGKEKERKKEREKFLKKNKHGQPVMKHRIDKILDKLEDEKS